MFTKSSLVWGLLLFSAFSTNSVKLGITHFLLELDAHVATRWIVGITPFMQLVREYY